MLTDELLETELRSTFGSLDPPTSANAFARTAVAKCLRARRRRRAALAVPAVASAAIASVIASGPAGTNSSALHLASYTFPLPPGYHRTALASAASGTCRPVVIVQPSRGAGAPTPAMQLVTTQDATAAAGQNGGCLFMMLSPAYTPTTTASQYGDVGSRGYVASQTATIRVGPYRGWLTTQSTGRGAGLLPQGSGPHLQLTILVPQARGLMRDLDVGSAGIDRAALLSIVASGLDAAG